MLETKGSERKSCRRQRKQTQRETDRQRAGGWGSLEESCRRQRQQTDRDREIEPERTEGVFAGENEDTERGSLCWRE